MRILGAKRKGSIFWVLQDGPVRLKDLASQLGGANKKGSHATAERVGRDRSGEMAGLEHQAGCGRLQDYPVWQVLADGAWAVEGMGGGEQASSTKL